MWYPTLIEIEKPTKRIFTSKAVPTSEFTQARNQLAEWRTWFSRPENVQVFIASYGINERFRLGRQMELHMVLIYGRREEFENSARLSEQRGSLLTGTDEELMSFDRLRCDPGLDEAITVRVKEPGRYEALSVSPLLRLQPGMADRLLVIDGIDEALENTPLLSASAVNS